MKDFLVNIIILIVSYLLGIVTTYLNQRTKNKALLADNQKLVQETERIKKEHALDIEKRKYQYESKKDQYFKYFNLLDSLSAKSSEELMEHFLPVISKFNEDLLKADGIKELEAKATAEYMNSLNQMSFEANESLIKIKQETNTIKLIANDTILNILSKMELNYDKSLLKSKEMMNAISKMILLKDKTELDNLMVELNLIGKEILGLKDSLINEVRQELGTI